MNSNKKYIKSVISSLLANDNERTNKLIRELTENIMIQKENDIMDIITESFKGDYDV
jgi:hypothetical protein